MRPAFLVFNRFIDRRLSLLCQPSLTPSNFLKANRSCAEHDSDTKQQFTRCTNPATSRTNRTLFSPISSRSDPMCWGTVPSSVLSLISTIFGSEPESWHMGRPGTISLHDYHTQYGMAIMRWTRGWHGPALGVAQLPFVAILSFMCHKKCSFWNFSWKSVKLWHFLLKTCHSLTLFQTGRVKHIALPVWKCVTTWHFFK